MQSSIYEVVQIKMVWNISHKLHSMVCFWYWHVPGLYLTTLSSFLNIRVWCPTVSNVLMHSLSSQPLMTVCNNFP